MEQGGEVAANPKGRRDRGFCQHPFGDSRYGEGFLIAEQVPVKLVPDALKNTNLKIIHRLVAEDDRKAVGGTMNLGEPQTRALMTLGSGEGVVYTEGMRKPVLVRVPLAAAKQVDRPVTSSDIRDHRDVRNFWQANSSLRLRFAACKTCKASVAGASCASHASERVSGAVQVAFGRLFNTLWVDGGLVLDAFEDFRSLCVAHPSAMREPRLSYCLFVEMVDAEAERRGASWGWTHREVETVDSQACELAALLEARRPGSKAPAEFEDLRSEFAKLLTGLHRSAHLPYAGCEACRLRCRFRYDMESPDQDAHVAEFQDAVDDEDSDDHSLAVICRSAAGSVFPTDDETTTNGAALCFAVQRFSTMAMTRDDQRSFSFRIAELLEQAGRGS